MSKTYYIVLLALEEVVGKEVNNNKEKISLAIWLIAGLVSCIACIFLSISDRQKLIVFFVGLALTSTIVSLVKLKMFHDKGELSFSDEYLFGKDPKRKINFRADGFEEHKNVIKLFQNKLQVAGIDSEMKIDILCEDIKSQNKNRQNRLDKTLGVVGRICLLVFWLPCGFLLGHYFKVHQELFHDPIWVVSFCILLFFIMVYSIFIYILITPIVEIYSDGERYERDRVLKYLNDVKYHHYLTDENNDQDKSD